MQNANPPILIIAHLHCTVVKLLVSLDLKLQNQPPKKPELKN